MRNDGAARPVEPEDASEAVPENPIAFSPRQVAGGFAIIAALLVLIVRRRRGRKKG